MTDQESPATLPLPLRLGCGYSEGLPSAAVAAWGALWEVRRGVVTLWRDDQSTAGDAAAIGKLVDKLNNGLNKAWIATAEHLLNELLMDTDTVWEFTLLLGVDGVTVKASTKACSGRLYVVAYPTCPEPQFCETFPHRPTAVSDQDSRESGWGRRFAKPLFDDGQFTGRFAVVDVDFVVRHTTLARPVMVRRTRYAVRTDPSGQDGGATWSWTLHDELEADGREITESLANRLAAEFNSSTLTWDGDPESLVPDALDDIVRELEQGIGPTWCLDVNESMESPGRPGYYIPARVDYGQRGYSPLAGDGSRFAAPTEWGPGLHTAKATVNRINAELGVSQLRALAIVMSAHRSARDGS